MCGMGGNPRQDICQPSLRVDIIHLGGDNEA
jgi:hypothetical protein